MQFRKAMHFCLKFMCLDIFKNMQVRRIQDGEGDGAKDLVSS
jgi:hypothetical protein